MPVLVEPTLLLADQLNRLPQRLVQSLWAELESTNQRLTRLLSEAEAARFVALDRHQAFQHCLKSVCDAHSVEPALLRAPYKFQRLVFARAQLAGILTELLRATQQEIARLICRDRSTISHTLVVHRQLLETDPHYRRQYQALKARCSDHLAPEEGLADAGGQTHTDTTPKAPASVFRSTLSPTHDPAETPTY